MKLCNQGVKCAVCSPELPKKKLCKERKGLVYLFKMQPYVCRPVAAGGTREGGRLEGYWLSVVHSEAGLTPLKPGGGALCQQHVPHCHADHSSRESCDAADNPWCALLQEGSCSYSSCSPCAAWRRRGLSLSYLEQRVLGQSLPGGCEAESGSRRQSGACAPRARRAREKQHHLEHS